MLVHRAGSLEAAVAAVRRRNLAISAGILLVLVGSVILACVSAQRARRLARQQLDFLAGVSHELYTPVTAIRSAAENLADGLVVDPEEVKEYGAILDHEGRRLSKMVNEVLELAGMQGRRRRFRPRPVAIDRIVDGAIEDSRWSLDEHQVEVERAIPAQLPRILADPDALRRAVHNLIENAVKYGGANPWIGLRAVASNASHHRREVALTVADRGPGIRRVDLRHVFEPFYQGRVGDAAPASGSGLGLSLVKHIVEQHGGRVDIDTGSAGTEVTIHLPAEGTTRETATDGSGAAG